MILIVGLGNPGMKYKTHITTSALWRWTLWQKVQSEDCQIRVRRTHLQGGLQGRGICDCKTANVYESFGRICQKLVRAYDVDEARELVVCYDDIDLPIGKLRIREEGSAGTHNGMRNIVKELNTERFARVRIGTKPMNLPITRLNLSILYCQRSILQTSRFCSSQSTLPSKRLK